MYIEICICALAMYTLVSKSSNKDLGIAMQRIQTEEDFTSAFATYETAKSFVKKLPVDTTTRMEVYQSHALMMKRIPENAMDLLNQFVQKVNHGEDMVVSWYKKYLYGVGDGVYTIFYATLFHELGFIKMERTYMPPFKGIGGSIRGYYYLVTGRAYPTITDFTVNYDNTGNDRAAKELARRRKKEFDTAYLTNQVPRMVEFIKKLLV